MFTGSNVPGTNTSWCQDCITAKPIIEEAMAKFADPHIHIVYVQVGDKDYWKSLNCGFKKDTRIKLTVIPTLVKWNTQKKLVGKQCEKIELLELMFTEDK